jgi:hypothetical protein
VIIAAFATFALLLAAWTLAPAGDPRHAASARLEPMTVEATRRAA